MKYSVLVFMAGCCRMEATISYGTPFIDNTFLPQTQMYPQKSAIDGNRNFYGTPFVDNAFLPQMSPQTQMYPYAVGGANETQKFDPKKVSFAETQAPINMNGNDYFYDDFNYQEEKNWQNKQKNLLNVRLLLQNSKRNYSFENGRLFRFTKQGREEITPIEVIETQKNSLLNGEGCFYDKGVLKFILCSSNEDMRELDKILPEGDAYNMFVFDKDTARYFYVKRNENNLPIGLVPLELVHKIKNENGQESSFLKIIDIVYEVCDGKMRYVGSYKEVESDCCVDTYGKVWQQNSCQGFNNYNFQQNQIMRVVDNYNQNINVPNNVNYGNYVQQYSQQNQMLNNNYNQNIKTSNLDKIMKLVDNYSDNINCINVPQKIQVTNYSAPNRMQNSLAYTNTRSRLSALPFQPAKR